MQTVVQQARRSRPVSDTVAVVVFDPSTCLACDGNLAAWAQARRRVPGAVVLLLSTEPDKSVRANFIAQRVPIDGSLTLPQRQQALPTPAEYLVVAGKVIASRHRRGAAQQAGLIDEFRARIDRP